MHEVEECTAGQLSAVDRDGSGMPMTLNRVGLFLDVGKEKIPLSVEPVFAPAVLVFDDELLTEWALHHSIVAYATRVQSPQVV